MRADYVQDWPVEPNADLRHHQSERDRASSSLKRQPSLRVIERITVTITQVLQHKSSGRQRKAVVDSRYQKQALIQIRFFIIWLRICIGKKSNIMWSSQTHFHFFTLYTLHSTKYTRFYLSYNHLSGHFCGIFFFSNMRDPLGSNDHSIKYSFLISSSYHYYC